MPRIYLPMNRAIVYTMVTSWLHDGNESALHIRFGCVICGSVGNPMPPPSPQRKNAYHLSFNVREQLL
jgi:hypothetical protein